MGLRAVPIAAIRLDVLLARRARLTPGECVTLVAGVASDLAGLHEQGRGHGDVRAARILVAPDGSVSLDDAEAASTSSPTDDVADLGRLVEGVLAPGAPALLVRLLAAAHSTDPEGRPDAAELADLVIRACPPTPIRIPHDRRSRASERPTVRRVAVAAVLGGALLGAIGLGRAWGGQDAAGGTSLPAVATSTGPPSVLTSTLRSASPVGESSIGATKTVASPVVVSPTPSTPSPAAVRLDWRQVVAALDLRRGRALATGRDAELGKIDGHGSPALNRDLATLRALAQRGVNARGWRLSVEVVVVERRTPHRVVLRIRDRLDAYRLVSRAGVVRHRVAARGSRWWTLELRQSGDGWLFWDARPFPA